MSIPVGAIYAGSISATTLTWYPPNPQPLSGWEIKRIFGLPHRWQWRAFKPGQSVDGTALSEAVAKVRAQRAYGELAA